MEGLLQLWLETWKIKGNDLAVHWICRSHTVNKELTVYLFTSKDNNNTRDKNIYKKSQILGTN